MWSSVHSKTHAGKKGSARLASASTPLAVSRALQLGVRVVELDCYDTTTKAKVCVTHGGTLCTAAPFASFIQAVKQNAFVASAYPVILTLGQLA